MEWNSNLNLLTLPDTRPIYPLENAYAHKASDKLAGDWVGSQLNLVLRCAKTDELIGVLFGVESLRNPKYAVLDTGPDPPYGDGEGRWEKFHPL